MTTAHEIQRTSSEGHTQHIPVLLPRVLEFLNVKPGDTVVDATLGGGGYTRALLERVGRDGRVIAFDWDERALERFKKTGEGEPGLRESLETGRLVLLHESFGNLAQALRNLGILSVQAIVADLGLSSDQLDDPKRGLSFKEDGPLDMRLNSKEKVTAARIVNTWSEEALADLFHIYGEEREARKIARQIVEVRAKKPFERTQELAELVKSVVSVRRRFGRIHPATQVFQALRIAVNSERKALEEFLPQTVECLASGGRVAIASFHSGEDALVKHFFQTEVRGCTCGMVPCICGKVATLTLLTKKPLVPTEEEVSNNPRSRSAKLRVAEKK